MSRIREALEDLYSRHAADVGPISLDSQYWQAIVGRFEAGKPTENDRDLVRQMARAVLDRMAPSEWGRHAFRFFAEIERRSDIPPLKLVPIPSASSGPPGKEPPSDLERKIFETGSKLLESGLGSGEGVDVMKRIRRAMDAVTVKLAQHRDLLNTVMRFTDVLPEIEEDSALVLAHFRQYFSQTDPRLPPFINWGIAAAHSGISSRILAPIIARGVRTMASLYIAGDSFGTAKKTFLRMAQNGEGIIAEVLGEAVTSDEEADGYRDTYLNLIAELPDHQDLIDQIRANRSRPKTVQTFPPADQPDIQMAIKLSALVPVTQWNSADPDGTADAVKKRLRPVLDAMLKMERQNGIKICLTVDPEEYEYRDLVYKIFKEVFMEPAYRTMSNIGIGLQAYLRDSGTVMDDLARWSRERGHKPLIRLIKGAYWDTESMLSDQKGFDLPVFDEKWMSDVNFERLADKLLDYSDVLRPAFGSHNARSLAYVIEQAKARNKAIEIQMLYGMADETKEDLVKMGIPVWVYSPMGQLLPGMAYLARRILENSSQNSFLLQRKSGKSIEELLQNPLKGHEHEWPPARKSQKRIKPLDPDAPFENEPLTDYSKRAHQSDIRAAIGRLRIENRLHTAYRYPLVIGGEKIFTTEDKIISVNPSDPKEIIGVTAKGGKKEAKAAVEAAKEKLAEWSGLKVRERAAYLLKAADIMRREKADLTALLMLEAGKTLREADGEVAEAIDFLEYYAREAIRLQEENPDLKFDAVGVTAVIAPWNFPLAILTGMTAASLVMGNTVVIKPASQTPVIGARLMNILERSGMPAGVANYFPGSGAALREAGVKAIAFTGSLGVGLEMVKTEVPKGVRVIAELGGKNALIIDRDANPDDVVKIALESKFGYSGQKCSALDRLIIVGNEAHYRKMITRLIKAAQSLRCGSVDDFGNYYGPVIDKDELTRLEQLIAGAAGKGGRVLLDGRKGKRAPDGHFLPPSIIEVDDPDSDLFQEEFFGPVLAVKRAATLEEAVEIAQNSKYGLTAGYIGRSPENEQYVVDHLTETGNLYINRKQTAAAVDRQPFGGVKLSGVGSKAGGRDYLSQFAKISRKNPVRLDAEANFELIGEKTAEKMFEGAIHQPQLLGESNRVDYHPRGTGLIVLDTFTDFSEAAGLLAAALFTGNNVRLLAAPNRKKEAEQLAKLWGRVRSDGFSFETVGMNAAEFEELFKVSSYPAYQWIAYHGQDITNPGSAYQKSVAKAVETPEGQRFVRSIIAPDDVYAEFASVFQGMTSPRTVTINTARHGLDARGSLTQAAPPALTMGTDSIREGAFDHLPHKEARARRTTAVGMKMFGFRGKGMRAQAGPRAAAHR